jgi:hypothetical protein
MREREERARQAIARDLYMVATKLGFASSKSASEIYEKYRELKTVEMVDLSRPRALFIYHWPADHDVLFSRSFLASTPQKF